MSSLERRVGALDALLDRQRDERKFEERSPLPPHRTPVLQTPQVTWDFKKLVPSPQPNHNSDQPDVAPYQPNNSDVRVSRILEQSAKISRIVPHRPPLPPQPAPDPAEEEAAAADWLPDSREISEMQVAAAAEEVERLRMQNSALEANLGASRRALDTRDIHHAEALQKTLIDSSSVQRTLASELRQARSDVDALRVQLQQASLAAGREATQRLKCEQDLQTIRMQLQQVVHERDAAVAGALVAPIPEPMIVPQSNGPGYGMMAESLMALRKEFEAGRAQLKAAHEEVRELRDRNIQLESEHSEMQVTCEQQVSAARQEKFQLEQSLRATREDLKELKHALEMERARF